MRIRRAFFVLPLVALASAPALAGASRAERGEAELAKVLEGRVAGQPVDCIDDFAQRDMMTIDGVGFVFGHGDTLYLNRPPAANLVHDADLPVFELRGGSHMCRLDRVEMRDRMSLIGGPVTFLGEFVPYHRPQRGDPR
jgi:hypothetical protein